MRTFFLPLLVVITSVLPVWSAYANQVQRFNHLPFRETPFADIKGIYPISEQQAKQYKHFELSYDDKGRVLEVKFKHGDKIVPLNISRNVVTYAPHIKIEYGNNVETRRFFDTQGNPTMGNGVFKQEFQLDKYGQRTSLVFYDYEGNRIEDDWGIYRYQWQVDKRGTVTEQRFDKEGEPASIRPGFPFYCLKLHYDQRGLLAMMENYGAECKSLTLNSKNAAQDRLEYNGFGSITAWNVYDDEENRAIGNSPQVARGVMEVDAQGHAIREYYENETGEMISNAYGWTDTYAEFDQHGNMTKRYNENQNGERKINPQVGYSSYILTYDKEGINRTKMNYFHNDKPVIHKTRGYHAAIINYNEQGLKTSISYLGVGGQLVNRLDTCTARINYVYDNKGRVIQRNYEDASGKKAMDCRQKHYKAIYTYYANGPVKNISYE